MFLALRELSHARFRYLLIGVILTLVAWLVFLLSGLANGLATDNASALINMKADYILLQPGSRLLLHRSLLPEERVAQVSKIPGVKAAAALGQLTATVVRVNSSEQIDTTILAIDPASFLAPRVEEGQSLMTSPANGVVVDEHFQQHGVKLGDQLKIASSEIIVTVTGFTSGQTYGHLPVMFTSIPLWQSLRFATPGSKGQISDPVSAVAVQMDPATSEQVVKAIPGVELAKRTEVLQNLPGYKEEMGTISMIQVFLFLIAAFIIAVFFYVLTLQKTNQFGILKALGANTRFLAQNLIGQVILLSLSGILAGALLSYGVAALIPANVPFSLETNLVITSSLALLVVALVGTLLSLWQIAKVDALVAIGKVD